MTDDGLVVGREQLLRVLQDEFERALDGRGRLVTVSGEPGIGKTTLVEAFAERVHRRGAAVLWGSAWESGGTSAYWPWLQVLRSARHGFGMDVPDLAPAADTAGPTPVDAAAAEQGRLAQFDLVGECLERMAAARPVVIVLEDVHAFGVASTRMLQYLATQARPSRTLFVATYRDVEARFSTAGDVIDALAASGTALGVPALTRDQVRQLAGTLDDASVDAIAVRTDGNPLFVAEVVRFLAQSGGSVLDVPLPTGLRQAMRARLRRIRETGGPSCADVLTAAAVIGDDVYPALLADVVGLSLDTVLDAVGEPVRAGLLLESAQVPPRYRFAHDMLRDTAYAELTPRRRAQLHLLVGRALAQQPGRTEHHARIAHHLLRAIPAAADAAEQAVQHAAFAGDQASSALAYEDAARWYAAALTALDHAPAASSASRCELLLRQGAALLAAGQITAAGSALEQATVLARREADAGLFGRAALLRTEHLDFNAVDRPAIALLAEAADLLAGTGDATEARVQARLAVARRHARTDEAQDAARRAVAIARRGVDPAALAEAAGDVERAAEACLWHVTFQLEIGERADAERALAALVDLAERSHRPLLRMYALSRQSTLAALSGRFADAARLADDAWRVATDGGLPDADAVLWGQLFTIWQHTDLADADEERMERIVRHLAVHSPLPQAHAAPLVLVELAHGQTVEAATRFEALVAEIDTLPRDMVYIWTLVMLAAACVELDAERHAQRIHDALVPYADRICVAAGAVACGGAVSHHLGGLDALTGRLDRADRHLTDAVQRHRRLGALPMLTRSLHAHEAVLLRRSGPGDAQRARVAGDEARELADRLGMTKVARVNPPRPLELVRDGDVWTVCGEGRTVQLADSLGLRYLHILVDNPATEISALDLVKHAAGAPPTVDTSRQDQIDERARAAYRARLAELDSDLAEAQAWNDPGRAEQIASERDFLIREITTAYGLGGRARPLGSDLERARVNVTRAIRSAIRKLAAHEPELAHKVGVAVQTGSFCRYTPD
jgi:predicted ATPase